MPKSVTDISHGNLKFVHNGATIHSCLKNKINALRNEAAKRLEHMQQILGDDPKSAVILLCEFTLQDPTKLSADAQVLYSVGAATQDIMAEAAALAAIANNLMPEESYVLGLEDIKRYGLEEAE